MTKLKGVMLGLFLIAGLTAYCQPTDSLQTVPVPKYVLWRMFHDISIGKLCDSLQNSQGIAIQNAEILLNAKDSLIHLQDDQIGAYKHSQIVWRQLYENEQAMTKAADAERKRWKLTTFIGGALIVLIAIL